MSDKTICTTCLRLKQGLCDGEKELTACPSYKRMTNADRIRAMTDEELADWVWGVETAGRAYGPRGKQSWLDWLKREAKDDGSAIRGE